MDLDTLTVVDIADSSVAVAVDLEPVGTTSVTAVTQLQTLRLSRAANETWILTLDGEHVTGRVRL